MKKKVDNLTIIQILGNPSLMTSLIILRSIYFGKSIPGCLFTFVSIFHDFLNILAIYCTCLVWKIESGIEENLT